MTKHLKLTIAALAFAISHPTMAEDVCLPKELLECIYITGNIPVCDMAHTSGVTECFTAEMRKAMEIVNSQEGTMVDTKEIVAYYIVGLAKCKGNK